MAQQRRSTQGKAAGRRRPKSSSPRSKSSASSKGGSTSRAAASKRSAAAKKGAATRRSRATQRRGGDVSAKSAAELREALSKRLIDPLGILMLTRDRIEETLSDAVSRGRMTADDAQDLVTRLVERGRKQTNDVLADLEDLLDRGREEIGGRAGGARKRGSDAARRAARQVEDATSRARRQAMKQAEPVMVQADRARRAAGIGPSFPISGYDDLTVAQVQSRLGGLTPAELRKVRDYERRHANRKTVLSSVEEKLA